LTPERYRHHAAIVLDSEKARALQKQVWKEIIDELKANVPELQAGLDGL
jgi:hypothetical protein